MTVTASDRPLIRHVRAQKRIADRNAERRTVINPPRPRLVVIDGHVPDMASGPTCAVRYLTEPEHKRFLNYTRGNWVIVSAATFSFGVLFGAAPAEFWIRLFVDGVVR